MSWSATSWAASPPTESSCACAAWADRRDHHRSRAAVSAGYGDRMTTIVRRATVLILIALLATTTSDCFFAIGGCSAEEADQLSRMSHYAGAELVPEGDGLGGCGAAFTTTDDPALVV